MSSDGAKVAPVLNANANADVATSAVLFGKEILEGDDVETENEPEVAGVVSNVQEENPTNLVAANTTAEIFELNSSAKRKNLDFKEMKMPCTVTHPNKVRKALQIRKDAKREKNTAIKKAKEARKAKQSQKN